MVLVKRVTMMTDGEMLEMEGRKCNLLLYFRIEGMLNIH